MIISPGSGVLPGRGAFSVSRHVRHGEARGERPGLAMLPPVGEESRSVTTPRSLMSTLFPQSRGPRRRAGSASRPGVRCGVAGRSSSSRSPRTGAVAVTVLGPDTADGAGRACPPPAGSPSPPPGARQDNSWRRSAVHAGRRLPLTPAGGAGCGRLVLQGANSRSPGTALPARARVVRVSPTSRAGPTVGAWVSCLGVIGWWL